MKFNRPDCYNWENCSAQLCPMDESSLANGIWYPDEEVCKKTPAPDWVKRQKKIAKKAKSNDLYFTYEMLNKPFRISPGIEGVDPNIEDWQKEVKKWIKRHPEYRVSEASKKALQSIKV